MKIGKLRNLCLIILLASSMGGLIGKSLVRERTKDPGKISVDITQKAYFLQFNTNENFTFKFGSPKGIRLFLFPIFRILVENANLVTKFIYTLKR
jgi:hypothetical protein